VEVAPGTTFFLVTAPLCCDWRAQAASAHSLTLWQQTKIESTSRAYSISACSRHVYMAVVVHAHPVCGESHIQHSANREFATSAPSLG